MSVATIVKERPIPFSGEMVRAIIEGRKTQTRRVVLPQPHPEWPAVPGLESNHTPCVAIGTGKWVRCPYGKPGDLLWVKEAIKRCGDDGLSVYAADSTWTVADAWPWKRPFLPSMFCPRGLSRIELEITDVRVERLQEITEEDAVAEGVTATREDLSHLEGAQLGGGWTVGAGAYGSISARGNYLDLWDSLNEKRGYGWDVNPWVWVISFGRVV